MVLLNVSCWVRWSPNLWKSGNRWHSHPGHRVYVLINSLRQIMWWSYLLKSFWGSLNLSRPWQWNNSHCFEIPIHWDAGMEEECLCPLRNTTDQKNTVIRASWTKKILFRSFSNVSHDPPKNQRKVKWLQWIGVHTCYNIGMGQFPHHIFHQQTRWFWGLVCQFLYFWEEWEHIPRGNFFPGFDFFIHLFFKFKCTSPFLWSGFLNF